MPKMIKMFAGIGSNTPTPVLQEVPREEFDAETKKLEEEYQRAAAAFSQHLANDDPPPESEVVELEELEPVDPKEEGTEEGTEEE